MVPFRTIAFTAALTLALATPAAAYFFATNDHELRTGPGGQTAVAGTVAEGQRIALIDCKADWCLVAAGRKKGWIEVKFIGVAADPIPAQPGLPAIQMPPTWRWRHGPLDFADPPLGRPRDPLATPDLHLR